MESRNRKADAKIRIPANPPQNMEELLQDIFWKDPELASIAKEFLDHVKGWGRSGSPYTVPEWENYCSSRGISQSRYHNMLKRLKNAGMIKKTYNKGRGVHELHTTDGFTESLQGMVQVWDTYLRL